MDDDIYKAPESNLIEEVQKDNELASRLSRLGASILDSLILMAVTLPVMYFTGGFDVIDTGVEPSWTYSLLIGLVGVGCFIVFNASLLARYGQTIGKKVVGIKIVDLDGNLPTIKSHLLVTYATYFMPGQIPVIGQLVSVINILFIFGKQRRCIHDHVAGTQVVNC